MITNALCLEALDGMVSVLRKEIEQLGIDFENIEHDQEISCE